jgi:hypothetical protein
MICTKNYSIKIETLLDPAAWFTMEVADPLEDAVAANDLPLFLGGLPMISAAGKVNLAETTNGDSDFARFGDQFNYVNEWQPLGFDINFFGWVYLATSAFPATMQMSFTYTPQGWPDSLTVIFSNSSFKIYEGATLRLAGFIPMDQWVFFQVNLAAADSSVTFTRNNSVSDTALTTFNMAATFLGASLMVQFSNGGSPPYLQKLDEFCLFLSSNLTPAIIVDIYNGGAGRTFP